MRHAGIASRLQKQNKVDSSHVEIGLALAKQQHSSSRLANIMPNFHYPTSLDETGLSPLPLQSRQTQTQTESEYECLRIIIACRNKFPGCLGLAFSSKLVCVSDPFPFRGQAERQFRFLSLCFAVILRAAWNNRPRRQNVNFASVGLFCKQKEVCRRLSFPSQQRMLVLRPKQRLGFRPALCITRLALGLLMFYNCEPASLPACRSESAYPPTCRDAASC